MALPAIFTIRRPLTQLFVLTAFAAANFGIQLFAQNSATRTRLFMDWSNVDKGNWQPVYDTNRLTDIALKQFASIKKDFNVDQRAGKHGMVPYHVPSGIRITIEKATRSKPWLVPDTPWEKHVQGATVIYKQGKYRCWYYKEKEFTSLSGLAWAIWDDGRLAGIQADSSGDFFSSSSETIAGNQILINARTFSGGTIEVELVQKDTSLPGFSFADCLPFQGDGHWVPLKWKGKSDLAELAGKKFQLHFRLTKAKLFSYRIPGKAAGTANP